MSIYLVLTELTFGVLGSIIIFSFARHFKVSPAPFLILFGLILGYITNVFDLLYFPRALLDLLLQVSVALILASLASEIRFKELDTTDSRALSMGGITIFLLLAFSAIVSVSSPEQDWKSIAAGALILVSAGAAARGSRTLHILNIQTSFFTPILITIAIMLGVVHGFPHLLGTVFAGIGCGLIAGLVMQNLIKKGINKGLAFFACTLGGYAACQATGHPGIIAALVTGLVAGHLRVKYKHEMHATVQSWMPYIAIPCFLICGFAAAPVNGILLAILFTASLFASRWISARLALKGTHYGVRDLIRITLSPAGALAAGAAGLLILNGMAVGFIPLAILLTQTIFLLSTLGQ
jgi:NhaP-type Na+/H+ or K+/H+ antiporter